MIIVVQGDNKTYLIENILQLSDSAQEDLQALIERAMTISMQQETESALNSSIYSARSSQHVSPRQKEIQNLNGKMIELDNEVDHLRALLLEKNRANAELCEQIRQLKLELDGNQSQRESITSAGGLR